MEFTAADIFQCSPFGDILNSLKSLSLSREPRPNYDLRGSDSDDEEIQSPPTAHLIATVDDISDMLDFGSEDFDGMDDEGGDEQEPAHVGRWTATSSYDIYMVDAPKRWRWRWNSGGWHFEKASKPPTTAAPLKIPPQQKR